MTTPISKTELLSAISISFKKLVDDLARVPQARAYECTMVGHAAGTLMSPANLVSYLLGWNELLLKWLNQDDKGEQVVFPETGYKWNQLGLLAQRFYLDYQLLSWAELLDRLRAVEAEIIRDVQSRSDEELYGSLWYSKWSKGRMIQSATSLPYTNARGRIRKWLTITQHP